MSGDELAVREARDSDAAAWNAFVDALPETSPLARYEWCHVLRESYGLRTHYLVAESAGQITGTLAAYESRGFLGERNFYSVRGGLVARDEVAVASLQDSLRRLSGVGRCVVSSGCRPAPGGVAAEVRTTVQLPVAADAQQMWSGLRDKTRNMIRRAEKEQLRIVSGLDQVDILVSHYQDNMLRLGVAIHSRRYFESVVKHLGQQSEILVAWRDRTPIASMLLHYGRDTACYPVQNAMLEYRALAPVQLLIWHAMKRCAEKGIGLLDMGESRQGSPVFQSKVNFGGTPRAVFYYDLSPRGGRRPDRLLTKVLRHAAYVTDTWLATRSPLPLRRTFAQKSLTRGRVM